MTTDDWARIKLGRVMDDEDQQGFFYSPTKKRVLVVFDHDIVIRNFLLSGVLQQLQQWYEVTYVFPDHPRVRLNWRSLPLSRTREVPVSPSRALWYRRLYQVQLLRRATGSLQHLWRGFLGRKSYWLTRGLTLPLVYALYTRGLKWWLDRERPLQALLEEEQPDLILHPSVLEGLFISDLIKEGERQGIPTVMVMNSWDNPATKALMVGLPTRLVVWGEQTRRHAVEHLGVPTTRVRAIGAVQFDGYAQPPQESADAYKTRVGLPTDRPILLYAGSSRGLNETAHLTQLDQAIKAGQLPLCAVLYRPHPWRSSNRTEHPFFSRMWTHIHFDLSMREAYSASWQSHAVRVDLSAHDTAHTILSAVDAVISPLSTMLLEGVLHGKPVLAYLPIDEDDVQRNLYWQSRHVHFQEFFDRVPCLRCDSSKTFIAACRALLMRAGYDARLQQHAQFFAESTPVPYVDRLRDVVESVFHLTARQQARRLHH